jgi:hypothetical protein
MAKKENIGTGARLTKDGALGAGYTGDGTVLIMSKGNVETWHEVSPKVALEIAECIVKAAKAVGGVEKDLGKTVTEPSIHVKYQLVENPDGNWIGIARLSDGQTVLHIDCSTQERRIDNSTYAGDLVWELNGKVEQSRMLSERCKELEGFAALVRHGLESISE